MHATAVLTFTVTDIKLAFESLEADLRALVQRTGLRTQAWAVDLAADVLLLAVEGHLKQFDLMLFDAADRLLRARTYMVDDGGSGSGDRSGGNLWPRTPDGRLEPVITFNSTWSSLSPNEQTVFKRDRLRLNWAPSSIDTSHASLSVSGSRQFSHNAARIQRKDYA